MKTRFTPYDMLRLFADQIEEIPDQILYLDDDIIVRRDLTQFYNQTLGKIEFVGVLDYWGGNFSLIIGTVTIYLITLIPVYYCLI